MYFKVTLSNFVAGHKYCPSDITRKRPTNNETNMYNIDIFQHIYIELLPTRYDGIN